MLKHAFIFLYATLILLGLAASAYFTWFHSSPIDMKLSFLVCGVVLYFFIKLFMYPQPRTEKNLNIFTIAIVISTIFSAYKVYTGNSILDLFLVLSVLFGWFLYVFWYSILDVKKSNLLEVGSKLPDFPLEDTAGNKVSSLDYLGSPLVIMFYRGNWCPLCMAQIKEIAQEYKTLENMGAKVLLISNQPHDNSESLSKKFDVNFNFLVDKDNKAAKMLDLEHKFGIPAGFQTLGYDSDTAMPTVIITDKSGKIILVDQTDNYRIRPEPSTFINVLKEHTA